ncbi:hypothetical protein [Umezawaea sp. Da 62-37]|uniref:hypothetical protein n=1 Tax=Umezawaea sp. Da 62-37 TaxID=3075927 RepID=UPI0028F74A84|nr:hypothetical protein [Umezawaea sp. Da 62-37]WNV83078.1 hypothetical protein RM788_33475 [Umezawaea sp. Da 62-37]
MVSAGRREINARFADARKRIRSPRDPTNAITHAELADAINEYLIAHGAPETELVTYNLVARYERGEMRWPSDTRRAAFRHVLGVTDNSALGFVRPDSSHRESLLTSPPHAESASAPDPFTRNPDTAGLAALRSMSMAFQMADRQVGGGALLAQVTRYLHTEVAPLLLAPDSGSGAAVFSAAASLTEFAGWMAHDAGKDDLARGHFDRAFRLASAADDNALAAMTCASMSHLAAQLGHGADAVRLAEAGLTRARHAPGTTALLARLHVMQARGEAVRGHHTQCRAALDQAERVLDDRRDEVDADWVPGFDEGALAAESALCLRHIGDLATAERHVRHAIALRPPDRVRARAFAHLTLADVLRRSGRIAEAATAGRAVSTVAQSLTSHRVQLRLDRLGAALTEHRATAEVRLFLDDLAAVRSGSVTDQNTASWPV